MITAEEQIRKARGGHASLHDRYGVENPVDPKAHAKSWRKCLPLASLIHRWSSMKRLIAEAAMISMETVWPENDST